MSLFHFRSFSLLLLLFCVSLVVSAPLPENPRSVQRRNQDVYTLAERYLNDLSYRDVPEDDLFKRDILVRNFDNESSLIRRNIFSSIKHAFQKAGNKMKQGFQKMGNGIKSVAQKIGNGVKAVAQKVGNGVKAVAQKVGNGVKAVAQKVGNGVKSVAQTVGNGVKSVALKAGQYLKNNYAMIGKFGLQILSTAESVGARVAGYIPGVGKPLQMALKAASIGTGIAADKIHADLPSSLQKGFDIMNKIKNPLSGVGGAVMDALRRDNEEMLFERDAANFDEDIWVRSSGEGIWARYGYEDELDEYLY